MQSSLTSLLLCLSTISWAGCGNDPSCGPGGAPDNGITVGDGSDISLVYGGFTASANNDCPGTNTSVTSLTVSATQFNGTDFLTLCFPHPDELNAQQPLGADIPNADNVHVVDIDGTLGDCTFSIDMSHIPTGGAQATGLCADGTDSRGFALTLDGAVGLLRCCGGGTPANCTGTLDSVAVTITGQTKVTAL